MRNYRGNIIKTEYTKFWNQVSREIKQDKDEWLEKYSMEIKERAYKENVKKAYINRTTVWKIQNRSPGKPEAM